MSLTDRPPAAPAQRNASQLWVRADGTAQAGWQVVDHSSAGLFLGRLDARPAPVLAVGSRLELSWRATDGETLLQVAGEVTHSSASGMRIRLAQEVPELRRFIGDLPAAPPVSTGRSIGTLPGRIIQLLRQHLGPGLTALVQSALGQLQAAPAGQPVGDGVLTSAEGASRLAAAEAALKSACLNDLCEPLLPATPSDHGSSVGSSVELELVDDDELELWLLRSEVATTLERQCGIWLNEIRQRLQEVAQELPALNDGLVLAPENILNALLRGGQAAGLDHALRQLLLRAATDARLLRLDRFYGGLIEALRAADIGGSSVVSLREIERSRPRSPSSSGRDVYAPAAPMLPAREAFAATRQIHALTLPAIEPDGAGVSNAMMLDALASLLADEAHGRVAAERFEQSLRQQLAAQAGQPTIALAPRQHEAVSLLARLYEALTGDPLLPERFRHWIHRLLPPLLGSQLASGDLDDLGDWIRQLFALLEFGAVLCAGRQDAVSQQIDQRIDALVEQMAAQTALTQESMQQACQDLEALLLRHRRAGAAVVERVVEACEGQQRLEDARQRAGKEVGLNFGGRRIPLAVAELLDEYIRPRLVLSWLREEEDTWLAQCEALQALAEGCRAARNGTDGVAAEALLAPWTAWLGDGRGARCDELLRQATEALQGEVGARWIDYRSDSEATALDSAAMPKDTQAERLELLRPGDWLAFSAEHGAEPRLLKLAWHAPAHARLVFVNQLGHKAEDLPREALLQRMREGNVQVLEEGNASVIERAWRRMLEGLHDELAAQATHDALTGLLNRKEFDRRLLSAIASGPRHDLGLLWVGVDHLRMVNQSHGMAAGDEALRAVAQNLRRFLKDSNTHAARIAGDEFALLLVGVDEDRALTVARNLCREVAERELSWQDKPYRLSVSVGVVVAGVEGVDPDALLLDAERAYRMAREDGGGKVYRYRADDERLNKLRQTAGWVSRIEQALARGELTLHGQPAQSLSERARQGPHYVEVLLRMNTAEALHTPEQFLLAAERYGQIGAIDRFVVRELLDMLEGLGPQTPLQVAFNLSARNLVDPDFMSELVARLRQQSFPCDRLCVELTETAAIARLTEARRGMLRLHELGVALVLDDFGSGYSSYQYLKHLPVDMVKVDGAFIRDIARAPEDLALARSINEVAHLLGKRTVAEHVEDAATLALVQEIGFDYAQGFQICRPQPLAEVFASLSANSDGS